MARDPIWRQAAPGYLGMVREGKAARVIVAESNRGAGVYYRAQVCCAGGADGPLEWVPVSGSSSPSLVRLLAKCRATVPGLSELVEGLPEDPAKAAPWFWAMLAERDRLRGDLGGDAPPFGRWFGV